jgi:hypothetical protein
VTDGEETSESLRAEIDHLRQLCKCSIDRQVLGAIEVMIIDLERRVRRLESAKENKAAITR